jgi:hypothetical protein
MDAGKRYEELPARFKISITEDDWRRKCGSGGGGGAGGGSGLIAAGTAAISGRATPGKPRPRRLLACHTPRHAAFWPQGPGALHPARVCVAGQRCQHCVP